VHGLPDEGEDIKVLTVPVSELAGMIEDGRIANVLTIAAVQWLLLYRDKLRRQWQTTA
jgi:ADP-ribose pyrophosphatase